MKFYRSGRDAMARLGLAAPEEMAEVEARFPVYVNEYYLGLIDPADWKNDPIARQVLPDEAELADQSSSFDPLAEEEQMPVPRLIHRFEDRVVLLATGRCAMRCRFCFRKREWADGAELADISESELAAAAHYLAGHPEIHEVLISGGDPLMQPEFSLAFLEALKREKIHTAFDTSCFGSQEVLKEALPLVDLFLVDFKHADPEVHRKLTGQSNERILENLRFLSEKGARIEIRIPFVPGCNDSVENLEATGRILGSLRGILCVKLLPYHALARTKYASLGMPDTMPQADSPDDDALHRAAAVLERFGLRARSGRE